VRANLVVVVHPLTHYHLRLQESVEELPVQQLVSHLPIEALDIPVLPRAARLDEQRHRPHVSQPLSHRVRRELTAVVASHVLRCTTADEELKERAEHNIRGDPALHYGRQALPRELVDHVQNPQLPAITGPVKDYVVAPDVVGALRPQPHAAPIGKPESPPFRLTLWDLEPLIAPEPFHPLMIDTPTLATQQLRYPAVTIPAILQRKLRDPPTQPILILAEPRTIDDTRPGKPQRPANPANRQTQALTHHLHCRTPLRRA